MPTFSRGQSEILLNPPEMRGVRIAHRSGDKSAMSIFADLCARLAEAGFLHLAGKIITDAEAYPADTISLRSVHQR